MLVDENEGGCEMIRWTATLEPQQLPDVSSTASKSDTIPALTDFLHEGTNSC